jgi:hypothetical protein
MRWEQIIDPHLPLNATGQDWYLVVKLHKLEQRVYGDF